MTYKLTDGPSIIRQSDGAFIPADPGNRDYAEFLAWKAAGNEPAPVDLVTPPVPASASRLGLMRALKEQGLWTQVKDLIAADPETQEEWDVAIEIKRTDPLAQNIIAALSLSGIFVDALLVRAAELVA